MILTFSLSLSTLQIIYKGNLKKRKSMPSTCFDLVVLSIFRGSYHQILNKAN